VKSKLDEGRLREIAQPTGGVFLPLADGPATMKRLYDQGLGKMQAGEIDTKMSRQPIERYQWPLGAAILALIASVLVNERKREPRRPRSVPAKRALAAASVVVLTTQVSFAAAPGLEAYRNQEYSKAYEEFRQTLEKNPKTRAADKIEFDAGAAAYKMKDYGKALQSFSQALLSKDQQLQSKSHYNLGNTLYQRGETQKSKDEKLKDWQNALQHYDQTLKIEPENKEAKENSEFVKNKIEELKKQQEQQQDSQKPKPPADPSEAAKKAKAEADAAVLRRQYKKALNTMNDQLKVDPTTSFYADYIRRLEEINGIKSSDTP
jgi:Ca-activated chloride channel family protein